MNMPEHKQTDSALTPELDSISQSLVNARMSATPLARFPGELPKTLDVAYTVQSASISRWSDSVGGWKVGMVPQPYRDTLQAERLVGPIFNASIHRIGGGEQKTMPIFDGGFAAVEAEFVFEIAADIPPVQRSYSDDELIQCVAALYTGAEIASSPMADVNRLGPCSVVSDFGNNAGLVIGPEIPDWTTLSPESMSVEVTVGDEVVGTASAASIEGGLLQALRFLIGCCAERGITLTRGTLVSCGAVTGIHDVVTGDASHVDFGEFGAFDVNFEPMRSS